MMPLPAPPGASLPALFDSTFRQGPLSPAFKRAVLGRVLGATFPWQHVCAAIGPERSEDLHGPTRPLTTAEELLLDALWTGGGPDALEPLRQPFGTRLEHVAALLAFARHASCLLGGRAAPGVEA